MFDFFTTEDYLTDSLTLIGPTVTNLVITPLMQSYGGGVFYSPEECSDYTFEDVPEVCQEFRAGLCPYASTFSNVANKLIPFCALCLY